MFRAIPDYEQWTKETIVKAIKKLRSNPVASEHYRGFF
jgi:hypothetical protein